MFVEPVDGVLSPCGRGDLKLAIANAPKQVRGISVVRQSFAPVPLIRLNAARRATFSHKGRRTSVRTLELEQ
jgi:hypothetical protein